MDSKLLLLSLLSILLPIQSSFFDGWILEREEGLEEWLCQYECINGIVEVCPQHRKESSKRKEIPLATKAEENKTAPQEDTRVNDVAPQPHRRARIGPSSDTQKHLPTPVRRALASLRKPLGIPDEAHYYRIIRRLRIALQETAIIILEGAPDVAAVEVIMGKGVLSALGNDVEEIFGAGSTALAKDMLQALAGIVGCSNQDNLQTITERLIFIYNYLELEQKAITNNQ